MKGLKETKDNIQSFPARAVIFKENDFSKDIYIVKKGKIRLFKQFGKKNLVLTQVEAGGILGEISIIDGGPRSATAIALEDTEVIKITPADFKETLKTVPDWFLAIARVLAQRLRLTDDKLGLSGPTVNEANVTAILLYLFSGNEDPQGLVQAEVEKTLMELLHITHNELTVALETLQKIRLIQITGGRVSATAIPPIEAHLDKLRQSFKSSFII